ncbi:hypothetical protein Mro03_36640 [Microbispora rosea subsp. rosea]|nr:hypothetical protein Mro03_36640 [Microbispora rosea subsp. rosea]
MVWRAAGSLRGPASAFTGLFTRYDRSVGRQVGGGAIAEGLHVSGAGRFAGSATVVGSVPGSVPGVPPDATVVVPGRTGASGPAAPARDGDDARRSGRVWQRDAEGRRHKSLKETHEQRLQDHDGRPGEDGGKELGHLTPR